MLVVFVKCIGPSRNANILHKIDMSTHSWKNFTSISLEIHLYCWKLLIVHLESSIWEWNWGFVIMYVVRIIDLIFDVQEVDIVCIVSVTMWTTRSSMFFTLPKNPTKQLKLIDPSGVSLWCLNFERKICLIIKCSAWPIYRLNDENPYC